LHRAVKKDVSHTAELAGYPKAQHLIEDLRRWILHSDYAQKCYLRVVRTFALDLFELGVRKEDLKIPEQQAVLDFFEKDWPTFLLSSALEKEGEVPSQGNKIYLQTALLEAYEGESDKAKEKVRPDVVCSCARFHFQNNTLPSNGATCFLHLCSMS